MDVAFWKKRLDRDYKSLDNLLDLRDQIEANPKASYEFDSGDGRVQVRQVKLSEVDAAIDRREKSIERIQQKINGTNAVSIFRMRR